LTLAKPVHTIQAMKTNANRKKISDAVIVAGMLTNVAVIALIFFYYVFN